MPKNIEVILAICGLFALTTPFNLHAQNASTPTASSDLFDDQATERRHHLLANKRRKFAGQGVPLTKIAPDDQKDVDLETHAGPGQINLTHPDDVHRRGFQTMAEMQFADMICNSDAVVIGIAAKSKSKLSDDSEVVFTRTRFSLDKVISIKKDSLVEKKFFVIREGGEVEVSGRRIAVHDAARSEYSEGSRYVLLLTQDDKKDNLFAANGKTLRVKNDRVYPDKGKWYSILAGAPLADVEAKIHGAINSGKCQ